jgi:hypothetical protein
VLHVHVVKSRAAQSDEGDPQLAEAVDNGGVHGIVDEHADTVKAVSQLHGIFVELGFKILKLHVLLATEAIEGGLVVVLGIKKCDLHGFFSFISGLYLAKSGGLYKYTEAEFLDNTNANEQLFALPVGTRKLGVDYDGNAYALTDNTITKFVARTAWSSVEFPLDKQAVYSSTEQKVTSFAFGVENNATYLLYNGSYLLSTPDLNLPTVNALPTQNASESIFSSNSATVEVVKTNP